MNFKILMLTMFAFVLVARSITSAKVKAEENGVESLDKYFSSVINKLQNKVISRYSQSQAGKQLLVKYFAVKFMRDINEVKKKQRKQTNKYMHWRHG